MMKNSITVICVMIILNCFGQNTAISDVNFEKALIDLGYDTGSPDGFVLTANINTITTLNISSKNINDLQGIQDFTALTFLFCQNNNLTDIKISSNTALVQFNCTNNNIASLDISNNTALVELFCQNNNLVTIDASKNTALSILSCSTNILTSLNIKNGNNTNIFRLDTRNNPNLTCIEVDNVEYSTANWTFIDAQTSFKENCAEMAYIPDDNFEKALIDLGYDSGNPDDYVPVSTIENITALNVSNKSITSLSGIEYFTALSGLDCSSNNLTALNLSKNTNLNIVYCNNNNLTTLELDQNSMLTQLFCYDNEITVLNVASNSLLNILFCQNNNLTNLNVKNGNNTNFVRFDATSNSNLTCIEVDNKAYSDANWLRIDVWAQFSENCNTLGVADFLESNISVYPNPTDNIVTINLDNQIEIYTVRIFDIQGRQMDKSNSNKVNFSKFSSGLYFLNLETNLGRLTKKVIKN